MADSWLWNVAALVGALLVAKVFAAAVCYLSSFVRAYVLAPFGIGRTDLTKYGKWAVVTGSSAGIGKHYALELAQRGLNIVLMSNMKDELQQVAKEIREKFSREVCVIHVDFLRGQEVYPEIAQELEDLDIGVLVNNVGMLYGLCYFSEWPKEKLYHAVELNCQVAVQMTRLVLPNMLKKGRGCVVNMSSCASCMALPIMTVYGATKVFVRHFSEALRKEYCTRGISVQTVTPLSIATALSRRPPSFTVPTPKDFSRSAVTTIGIQDTTYGCWIHAVLGYILFESPFAFCWGYPAARKMRQLSKEMFRRKSD